MDRIPNNLPLRLSSFIGRERELAEVARLLASSRLVTLTGSGGCGKTRLALEAGAKLCMGGPAGDVPPERLYRDGIWLVELASLTDPAQVPQRVADTVGVHEQPGRPFLSTLGDTLHDQRLLLILDNCEHLIEACARLAETLLETCAGLSILATSREPLNIAGETTFIVPSLSAPDPLHLPPFDSLSHYEAVRLFTERAQAASQTFALTPQNANPVAHICHQLDGMPLAIELAAACTRALSVEQVAERLVDCFRLLTGGKRTALPRHQTLRATIAWSYGLMSAPEQALFRRLAVFSGAWTVEAAERVCADDAMGPGDVLNLLRRLVDKSLVIAAHEETAARFGFLETVRQFAHDKLAESVEMEHVLNRHLDFFVALAESASTDRTFVSGSPLDQLGSAHASVERLDLEHPNLRAALAWSLGSQNIDCGLRLGYALWWFWHLRGYIHEGSEWLRRMMDAPGFASAPDALRVKGLEGAAGLAWRLGDMQRTTRICEALLPLCERLGDKGRMAFAFGTLGALAMVAEDYAQAEACHRKALALRQQLGYQISSGYSLGHLSIVAWAQGHREEAAALCEEGLKLHRQFGSMWHIADSLVKRGTIARAQSHDGLAQSLFRESLTLQVGLGDKSNVAYALEGLACLAAKYRQPSVAAMLWGTGEAIRRNSGLILPPAFRRDYEPLMAQARAMLGADRFDAAWSQGRLLPLEQAIAMAESVELASVAATPSGAAPASQPAGLTARELEILRLVAQGLTDPQIAQRLVISTRTVNAHLRSIYDKLDVTTRTAAATFALQNKIV